MNKEIALASSKELSFEQINEIAEIFQASGMFSDVKSKAAIFVKILAGQELGIPAFAAVSGVHVIHGKPTVGAGIMASKIKASPKYNYEIKELTKDRCLLDFFENGKKKGESEFTRADAIAAGTQNLGKYPKNMLFARAISNGQKWFAPDLYDMPVYVPEEMQEITLDAEHEEIEDDLPTAPEQGIKQEATVTPDSAESTTIKLKPKATEKAINAAIERIKAGEPNVISKTRDYFDLTEEQDKQLTSVISVKIGSKEDEQGLKPITEAQFRQMFKLFKTGENASVLIEARQLFTFKDEYEAKILQIVNEKYNGVEPTELDENGN